MQVGLISSIVSFQTYILYVHVPSISCNVIFSLLFHSQSKFRNDGDEPDYMAMNPSDWLSSTMEACCKKFFGGYLYDDCIGKHSQGHDDCNVKLYYPDWNGDNEGCTDDGKTIYCSNLLGHTHAVLYQDLISHPLYVFTRHLTTQAKSPTTC